MIVPMQSPGTVFICEGSHVTIVDVIHAALFRDELQSAWETMLAGRAVSDALDEDPDEETVQTLSEQFRYDHDLITAEETEEWLAARGLTLDDFADYFLRRAVLEQNEREEPADDSDYVSADDELRELLRVELLLSGD